MPEEVHQPHPDDVDLSGGREIDPLAEPPAPPLGTGPNAVHPNDPEGELPREEGEVEWPDDEQPGASAEPSSSDGQDDAPTPASETQTEPTPPVEPSAPADPIGEDGGEDEPEPEPEPRERSGAKTRPYTILEEQVVVPFHLLTDAQKKALQKHSTDGFIARDKAVVAANIEALLENVYTDGAEEHVSRVLALSERAYQPAALELEPVQRTRLRIRR